MMITVQSYFQQIKAALRRWSLHPAVHSWLRIVLAIASGFVLSAASLAHHPQPFAAALICALVGAVLFLPTLNNELIYDDPNAVTTNR